MAEEIKLRPEQVRQTAELLDSGNTVPFIARYRKEVTDGLDEEQIRHVEDRVRYLRTLQERKETVLESIEKQGKLTPELKKHILQATKLQEIEDLYLPYRPKKRTRATVAKEKGLEPLAGLMLAQELQDGSPQETAASFIDPEKDVNSAEDALAGARDIVAEIVSEHAEVRQEIRKFTFRTGLVHSKARKKEDLSVYEMYADYSERVKHILPHRILAINRGEREGFLRVSIDVEVEEALQMLRRRFLKNQKSIFAEQVEMALADSYQRLINPAIERDLRHDVTEKADEHAIKVFAENVKNLILAAPVRNKIIMGIDPGFRSGCKVAVIDETGKSLAGIVIYPHPPQKRWDFSKNQLKELIEKYDVAVIAIGNGTASRESEQLAAEIISEMKRELFYVIVSEAGASVYSASEVAREEFPDLPAEMRGNISIARRLLDPLSELVKIDPKSIGVGLYQHDVNQNRLAESLDRVVESAVNYVGVNLNTASKSLLRYVAGINNRTAENIVKYREEKGRIQSRQELTKIKGLGEMAFTQAAGFLRIPDADIFFDSTAVHPESYQAAENLLKRFSLKETEVKANGQILKQSIQNEDVQLAELAGECGVGAPTLEDIIASLEKPNRDPRDDMPKPMLRRDILKMDDLKEGMVLKGTVRNVVDFGAFVDIGLKTDGLVHKSQMSDKFVKNPMEIVAVGDVIDVKVLNIDAEKGRIGLSMVV
ncbi:MAG: RNA-binding transcriptional accessory protein [Caldithrix sp.]|nr:MAG: RNA-binding transcriptional accessory protein [Caldithrix sp.]